jgi:5-methylcytosine-specific restriction endonuclease McrA
LGAARRSRAALPFVVQVRVFRRDCWLCTWCHRPVVFAPALRLLREFARERGHEGPLAYHDPRWRRDRAPLLDHMAAVVDHREAFSRGGAHEESNFVTACNKCNARKNNVVAEDFKRAVPPRAVKGKYGEPQNWDGLSTLFILLARDRCDLPASEKGWLAALTA